MHRSLERIAIKHKDDPYVYSTLTAALIGPMKPAEYMAVGMEEDGNRLPRVHFFFSHPVFSRNRVTYLATALLILQPRYLSCNRVTYLGLAGTEFATGSPPSRFT